MSNGTKKWYRVNFVTIFGGQNKIKLWGICNNFNQFAHLSSASGPSNDVIMPNMPKPYAHGQDGLLHFKVEFCVNIVSV